MLAGNKGVLKHTILNMAVTFELWGRSKPATLVGVGVRILIWKNKQTWMAACEGEAEVELDGNPGNALVNLVFGHAR